MSGAPTTYSFGPFQLDRAQRLLLRKGKPVPLAPKAVETLLVLVENSGRLVEKDDLMKQVWPDTFVEEGNLTANIHLLRKVLGKGPRGQEYIETIPRRGYRFMRTAKAHQEDPNALKTKDIVERRLHKVKSGSSRSRRRAKGKNGGQCGWVKRGRSKFRLRKVKLANGLFLPLKLCSPKNQEGISQSRL